MQLLPSARPDKYRSKALRLGTYGHCMAKPPRLCSYLALGSPKLLHQGNVGLADESKPEVAQDRDVGHNDLEVAVLCPVPAVPQLPARHPSDCRSRRPAVQPLSPSRW